MLKRTLQCKALCQTGLEAVPMNVHGVSQNLNPALQYAPNETLIGNQFARRLASSAPGAVHRSRMKFANTFWKRCRASAATRALRWAQSSWRWRCITLRHAARPSGLGRRPSGVRAQDPDRATRSVADDQTVWRHQRFSASRRIGVRHVRRRPRLDFAFGRAGNGDRARSKRRESSRRRVDRRCVARRRHGDGGDQPGRPFEDASDRRAQRQRDVDRAGGRRA